MRAFVVCRSLAAALVVLSIGGLVAAMSGPVVAKEPPRAAPPGRASAPPSRASAPRISAPRFTVQRAAPAPRIVQRAVPRAVERPAPRVVQRALPRQIERVAPRIVERRVPRSIERAAPRVRTTEPRIAKPIGGQQPASRATAASAAAKARAAARIVSQPTGRTPAIAGTAKPPLPGRMGLSPAGGAPKGSTVLKVAPAAAVGAAAVAGAVAAGAAGKSSAAAAALPAGVKTGNGRGIRPPGSIPRSIVPVLAAGAKPGLRPGQVAAPLFASKFPRIAGHKFTGRPRLPLYFVAGAFGFGATYWAYRTSTTYVVDDPLWLRPLPSCYVGGGVFYREPGTGACFNFAAAEPGDYFECNNRVYRWAPERASSVEDIVADDDAGNRSVVYDDWVKSNASYSRAKAGRAATVVPVSAPVEDARLDCSSCLGALGPIETGNGMCTLTLANNCPQPISFKGGMSRATDDRTITCEFSGDLENGGQKTVCTAACASFDQAVTYVTGATPKAGWTGQRRACRVIDPSKAAAAKATAADGIADIYAQSAE